jgi:NTE family protein
LVVFGLGIVVAYNVAAGFNWIVYTRGVKPDRFRHLQEIAPGPSKGGETVSAAKATFTRSNRATSTEAEQRQKEIEEYFRPKKIGIILAGGGAKGAYQAGAMKAIYEFLDEHGALENVKMVAGTSIGSWNGLFWYASFLRPDMIYYKGQRMSAHEYWWKRVNAKALVAPSWYVPLLRNALLSSRPWRDVFDRSFAEPIRKLVKEGADRTHFYFTFTNVESGRREFVTNNPQIAKVRSDPVWPELFKLVDHRQEDEYLCKLRNGVFASMDLPPLFPYWRWENRKGVEYLEDGGVIDNLPLYFGTGVEHCDFLFVLPLNASFEDPDVNKRSLALRLFRVMDMRQGELERRGFKSTYLYNEQAILRKLLSNSFQLGGPPHRDCPADWGRWLSAMISKLDEENKTPATGWEKLDATAMKIAQNLIERDLRYTNILAVAPKRPLLIGTAEFWKTREAGKAFDVMYKSTKGLLGTYNFEETQETVKLHLVSQKGVISKTDMF